MICVNIIITNQLKLKCEMESTKAELKAPAKPPNSTKAASEFYKTREEFKSVDLEESKDQNTKIKSNLARRVSERMAVHQTNYKLAAIDEIF